MSPATNGLLVQVYPHGEPRTAANLVFEGATNVSSGSPACGGAVGFPRKCTALVDLPPTRSLGDDIVIASYDTAPSSGTIPSSAHVLGVGALLDQSIAAGKNNQLLVYLGGVIDSLKGNPGTIALPADGVIHQVAIVIDPEDYHDDPITAGKNDPFANPITVTLTQTGGSGHASLSLNGGSAVTHAIVSHSSDTVELEYDGRSSIGYALSVSLSAARVSGTGGASETMKATTLALGSSNADYTAGALALRGNGDELTMNVGESNEPSGTTFSMHVSGCSAVMLTLPLVQQGGAASFVVVARPESSSGGCLLLVSDGTSTIDASVTNAYSGVLGTPSIAEYSSGLSANQFSLSITVGPDGAMWFSERGKIGRVPAVANPTITETTLPTNAGTANPTSVALGADGNLWWAAPVNVGYVSTSGTGEGYAPTQASVEPAGITAGSDGAMWFTQGTCPGTNAIGRITTSGTITNYTSGISSSSELQNIALGSDGNVWFSESDTSKIAKITPSGVVTEFSIPTGGEATAVTAGPDGAIWFAQETAVDRIPTAATSGSDITRYVVPGSGAGSDLTAIAGITTGPDGALWMTSGNGYIGRFDPVAHTFSDYQNPTSGVQPNGIAAGPDGAIWFTEDQGNAIGRVSIQSTASARDRHGKI